MSSAAQRAAPILMFADFRLPRREYIAAVKRRRHILHGYARRPVAIQHRPLDGRASPVFRQQGCVDIDTAERRHL